jgi:hypothetical protein
MRIGPVVIIALSMALLGSAAGDGGQIRQKPTLNLQRGDPLTLRGAHFVPAERVAVSVRSDQRQTKRVTANDRGVFVVSFPRVTYDRCQGLSARAVGSRGSRAGLKTPQLLCPPSL